jgi:hypothetical protein
MTRGITQTALQTEAIRLRVEERKSLKEIQAQLGVSLGSLSPWLKSYPLTNEEIRQRHVAKNRARFGSTCPRTREVRGEPSKFWSLAQGLTSQQMARLGEAAIQFRLTLHGFRSFRPSFDGDRVDFLVLDGARALRIQVKCVHKASRSGLPSVSLRRTMGHNQMVRYTPDEIDFIVGYWAFNDTAYVYALSELDQAAAKVVSTDGAERWDKLRV